MSTVRLVCSVPLVLARTDALPDIFHLQRVALALCVPMEHFAHRMHLGHYLALLVSNALTLHCCLQLAHLVTIRKETIQNVYLVLWEVLVSNRGLFHCVAERVHFRSWVRQNARLVLQAFFVIPLLVAAVLKNSSIRIQT